MCVCASTCIPTDLSRNNISIIEQNNFKGQEHLDELDLSSNKISGLTSWVFDNLKVRIMTMMMMMALAMTMIINLFVYSHHINPFSVEMYMDWRDERWCERERESEDIGCSEIEQALSHAQ